MSEISGKRLIIILESWLEQTDRFSNKELISRALSRDEVLALLSYFDALEEVVEAASTDIKVWDCAGWDKHWCPTSCGPWKTCQALAKLEEMS